MTDPSPTRPAYPADATDNPVLSAEEIGRRYLKLFDGLENRDDLTLEYVQKITGLRLRQTKDGRYFVHRQELEHGWVYGLIYSPQSQGVKKGIGLDFMHLQDGYSNMTPVCALDFEYYHNELKRMGFDVTPKYGEIGDLLAFTVDKILKDGEILRMTLIPQNLDTRNLEGKVGRLCVKSIGTQNSM